ncbi:TPA: cbb3-type cytochrome c oxidase subunit 3 [Pseudomonas aeruginosa]|nr:cbb3-type cytochrome c oxidase subunit 3 [Pseudomonas aeruginosa]
MEFSWSEILLELLAVAVLFFGVHWSLRHAKTLDQASMPPFADDEEVARRVERETGRSRTGCGCPGRCQGDCRHWDMNWPA